MNIYGATRTLERRKEPGAEPTTVTGRQDPSQTMIEGQDGCGGRTEERIPASGVVWNETPESAIHSVLVGGVSPMMLKDCARAAWSHPPGQVGGWLG